MEQSEIKRGDIVTIGDRKYVVYDLDPWNGMPCLMDFQTGVKANCWFAIKADAVIDSQPTNVVWLSLHKKKEKLSNVI